MKEITVKEFYELSKTDTDFYLLDVREPHEKEIADIGGELIPLGTLADNLPQVDKNRKLIVYCRSGGRSGQAGRFLTEQGYTDVYNLVGGILDYSDKIDNSIKQY